MPLSDALDRELDAHLERARAAREAGEPEPGAPGTVQVEADGVTLEAEVTDCERIGATVERLKVRRDQPGDVEIQAQAIAERLHGLGERVQPVEVAPDLGGAVLRTRPEDMVEGRFYQIDVGEDGQQAELERLRVDEQGQRQREPFTVTRENLGRVVDGLAEGLKVDEPSS
jgi:hypothetical protein